MENSAISKLADLVRFLSDPLVSSLLAFHPNDLGASSFQPPSEWTDWWDWASCEHGDGESADAMRPWLSVLLYYDQCRSLDKSIGRERCGFERIPASLRSLVEDASRLAVPRERGRTIFPPDEDAHRSSLNQAQQETGDAVASLGDTLASPGMSPKKAHEVVQMCSLIETMLKQNPSLSNVKHVVDVGAGQAYLSRMLRDRCGLHVLALDFSDVQTQGAAKRDAASRSNRSSQTSGPISTTTPSGHHTETRQATYNNQVAEPPRGSLTYVTAKIDAESLCQATCAWIESELPMIVNGPFDTCPEQNPTPVLFVALHACGSLTPDILRAFTAQRTMDLSAASWIPQAAVVVGCCYNMMRPEDFPLSRALRSSSSVTLNPSHLQLAAQVPSQWTRSEKSLRNARLALRKIVWRALIQDVISPLRKPTYGDRAATSASREEGLCGGCDSPEKGRSRRLGRLNNSAYADWETFSRHVQRKLGMPERTLSRADRASESRIEVFHVLRCIVGPVVETLILLDRAVWMEENLRNTGLTLELVNLFDQASGSGRIVAIVIQPDDRTRRQPSRIEAYSRGRQVHISTVE